MEKNQNISALIIELRKRLSISQEKLAARLKVSLPTINRWEKGKTRLNTLTLHAIEKFVRELGPEFADLYDCHFKTATEETSAKKKPDRSAVLDTKSMENLLWKAACSIRGEKDAPKFKDYILPLIFIKRLSDVFEDEIARLTETYGDEQTARTILEEDHSLVRFYIPPEATWPIVSRRQKFDWPEGKRPKTLGEQLTQTVRAIAKANPTLQGVIDIVDYNEVRNGEREISDEAISRLIELLIDPKYRLGLNDVEPDFLGRAYEYLLRKFAESQGQSAGEFFTPKEVGWLMAYLMQGKQGEEVYDPCCGSGGLLIKCELALNEQEKEIARPLKLYGQEWTGSSFAIARMNMILHDMEGEVVRGNTMTNPKFLDERAQHAAPLRQFDIVVTNPMWNQKNFDETTYENDPYERFTSRGGFAPTASADWAWLQHVLASLKDNGRAAMVIDTGAASRGSGNQGENKEKAIRRWFVEQDVIEGVILLPDNLFYNATAAGIIIVLNRKKPEERNGKIVLVNASGEFQKGRPKNFIPDESIKKTADAFHAGKDIERFVKVVATEEVAKNDYNLSPSRYIETAAATEHRDVQVLLDELAKLDVETQRLDGELKGIFEELGYKKQTEIGEIPESWEAVRVGELMKLCSGASRPSDLSTERNEMTPFPVYGGNGVMGYSSQYLTTYESIVVGRVGAYCGSVHICPPYSWVTDNALYHRESVSEKASLRFLAELLRYLRLNRLQRKGAQPLVTQGTVHSVQIPLPSKAEQDEIANIATVMEKRIEAAEQKLGSLKLLFSSMLHLLMTGQVRVKSEIRVAGGVTMAKANASQEYGPAGPSKSLPEGVKRFVEEVARQFVPERIILFGSYAEGGATPDSDMDLLVVMEFEGRARDQAARIGAFMRRDFPLDLLVRRPEDLRCAIESGDPFFREIVEKGEVLYARSK